MQDNIRLQKIAKTVSTDEDRVALRRHLRLVVESEAFKGSRRSAQFLSYVMEKSLDQQLNALKERTIGIELFGRAPTYDTGEDAIVRVTATDVRRRLLQHYGNTGMEGDFRISLPPGGYIPEIQRGLTRWPAEAPIVAEAFQTAGGIEQAPSPAVQTVPARIKSEAGKKPASPSFNRLRPLVALAVLVVVVGTIFWWRHFPVHAESNRLKEPQPWSAVFHSSHPVQVIASDPDLDNIQTIVGRQLSLSEYANEDYGCEHLNASLKTTCQFVLRGNKVAAVDAEIVAKLAALAEKNQNEIVVRPARETRLKELRTNDNYVLLGSPRSNPWVGLFSDQMDYQIQYDPTRQQEIVVNTHPQAGEADQYVPTAKGFGTGQSLATVSFLRNPNQSGQVLLLAGTTAEGTQAASEFATNVPLLSSTLKNCGVLFNSPYQVLLRVKTMAGSATQTSILNCHKLAY